MLIVAYGPGESDRIARERGTPFSAGLYCVGPACTGIKPQFPLKDDLVDLTIVLYHRMIRQILRRRSVTHPIHFIALQTTDSLLLNNVFVVNSIWGAICRIPMKCDIIVSNQGHSFESGT